MAIPPDRPRFTSARRLNFDHLPGTDEPASPPRFNHWIYAAPFSFQFPPAIRLAEIEPSLPKYPDIYSEPISHTHPGLTTHFNCAVVDLIESEDIFRDMESGDPKVLDEVPIYAFYLLARNEDWSALPAPIDSTAFLELQNIDKQTFLSAVKRRILNEEAVDENYNRSRAVLYSAVSSVRPVVKNALQFSTSRCRAIKKIKDEVAAIQRMYPVPERAAKVNSAITAAMEAGLLNPIYLLTRSPFNRVISVENRTKLIPWLICRCNLSTAFELTEGLDPQQLSATFLEAYVQLAGACPFYQPEQQQGKIALERMLNLLQNHHPRVLSEKQIVALALTMIKEKYLDGLEALLTNQFFRNKIDSRGWMLVFLKAIDTTSVGSIKIICKYSPENLSINPLIPRLNELIDSIKNPNPKFENSEEMILGQILLKHDAPDGLNDLGPTTVIRRCIEKRIDVELEGFIRWLDIRSVFEENDWFDVIEESARALAYNTFCVLLNEVIADKELFDSVLEILENVELSENDQDLENQRIEIILDELINKLDDPLSEANWLQAISSSLMGKCNCLDPLIQLYPYEMNSYWVNNCFLGLLQHGHFYGMHRFSLHYNDQFTTDTIKDLFTHAATNSNPDDPGNMIKNYNYIETIEFVVEKNQTNNPQTFLEGLFSAGRSNSISPFTQFLNAYSEKQQILSDPRIYDLSPNSCGTLLQSAIFSGADPSVIQQILRLPQIGQMHKYQIEMLLETILTIQNTETTLNLLSKMVSWDCFGQVEIKILVNHLNKISPIRSKMAEEILKKIFALLSQRDLSPYVRWQLFSRALSKGFDTSEIQAKLNYSQVQLEWVQNTLNTLAKYGNVPAIRALCNLCSPHLPSVNWDQTIENAAQNNHQVVVRQLEHYRSLVQNGLHANPNGIRAIRFN